MKKALVIHHLRTGIPDLATQGLIDAGYTLDHRHPIDGDTLPPISDNHSLALVHGSLADVTRHNDPGIAEEMRWIDAWWQTDRPYFGICHGLQLAAQHLGARVGAPQHKKAEFGLYPLISHAADRIPNGLHCFQWHYYGADLPKGTQCLASSHLYPNQIIDFGQNRLGIQGHPEQPQAMQQWFRQNDPTGPERPGAQSAEDQTKSATKHNQTMHDWFRGFFQSWLDQAEQKKE